MKRTVMELPVEKSTMYTRSEGRALERSVEAPRFKKCVVKLRRFKIVSGDAINLSEPIKSKQCLLRDRHLERNKPIIKYHIKKCIVKLRRFKFAPMNKECTPSKRFNTTKCSQVREHNSVEPLAKTTEDVTKEISTMNTRRSSVTFKNPALSLTKRRAYNLGLKEICSEKPTSTAESSKDACHEESNRRDSTKSQKCHQNLMNKPEIIAELLCNEFENEDALQSNDDITTTSSTFNYNILKDNKNTSNTEKNQRKVGNSPIRKASRIRETVRKTNSSSSKDVYDFLSQSQSSESNSIQNRDPAADVIKKLIAQGKVCVTKYAKGRPVAKHRIVTKKKIAKKKLATKKVNNTVMTKKVAIDRGNISVVEIEKNNDFRGNIVEENQAPISALVEELVNIDENTSMTNHGTFSGLARSVLMNQSGIRRPILKTTSLSKEVPTENVRRQYSTPYKKASAELAHGVDFSPIPFTSFRTTNVDPKIASFSNDLDGNVSTTSSRNNKRVRFPLGLIEETSREQRSAQEKSSISSFSSNDSNAENLPPQNPSTSQLQYEGNLDKNSIIHSARQFSNPRRVLTQRSPLKPINIIDVVILPPYKKPDTNNSKLNESLNKSNETQNALFGFEEYIDERALDNSDDESTKNDSEMASTSSIHIQRQRLKKFRTKRNIKNYESTKVGTKPVSGYDFDTKRNHNIKEMLCSTMINTRPSKDIDNTAKCLSSDSDDEDSNNSNQSRSENGKVDLFGDPESTFDHERLHRTYERPLKRKRKLQHQYAVDFDSDEYTDDEDIQNFSPAKINKRTDRKHQNNEKIQNKELEKFANEFNTMLKEAEDYELIVH